MSKRSSTRFNKNGKDQGKKQDGGRNRNNTGRGTCGKDWEEVSPTGRNDLSWYDRNPELLASVSRIPAPYVPGMVVPLGAASVSDGVYETSTDASFVLPGVMTLKYAPSVGYSNSTTSPASIAAREIYARVRSKYSGSLDADAPDIFMYMMALDSIHSYLAYIKRIYRLVNMYNPLNRNYPDTVLEALGISLSEAKEIRQNLTEFWGIINTLIRMANKFTVPDDMPIYTRHKHMCEHVYRDSPDANCQSYVFMPTYFYKVDTTDATGTKLVTVSTPQSTVSQFYEKGIELIAALSDWDDAYTINGYLMRAYEGAEWLETKLLDENDILAPVYDEEMLSQIENFTAYGPVGMTEITQDPNTNAIIHTPIIAGSEIARTENLLMNFHMANTAVDGRAITEASRMSSLVDDEMYVHAGTEIGVSISITHYWSDGEGSYTYNIPYIKFVATDDASYTEWAVILSTQFVKTHFDWAPRTLLYMVKGEEEHEDPFAATFLNVDLATPVVVTMRDLDNLHRVCVYSLFNCFN